MSDLVNDSYKHVRFKRVAQRRLERTLEDIQSLANCAKTASYAYTEEEVNFIFSELEKSIAAARDAFAGKKKFSLTEKDSKLNLFGLKEALMTFYEADLHGCAEVGDWKIVSGGYDLWFQVMYKDEIVLDCIAGKLESNYGLREGESEIIMKIIKTQLCLEEG